MNRLRLISASSMTALTLAFAGFAHAQDDNTALKPQAEDAEAKVENRRITTIINSKVIVQGDEAAGKAVDLIISDSGCIEYIVADYNDQYYYIPYSVAQVRAPQQVVFVDVTPAQFRQVQFFRGNAWPAITPTYRQNVFQTFGVSVNVNNNNGVNNGRGRNRAAKPDLNDATPPAASGNTKEKTPATQPEKAPGEKTPPAANPEPKKPAPKAENTPPKAEQPAPKDRPTTPRAGNPSSPNPAPRPKVEGKVEASAPKIDPGTIDPPGPAPKPE